ncbi:MAG TPA: fumarylacetoacetate hydrolase family protein [Alphaproteobacteria bacterium]|nr:fumarylacetoacetate hydrolase family protein [Alphaproteobacteria bacterium]
MPDYVFPPLVPAVPVEGGGAWPVRRVFCVGRNYAEHQREMGHSGAEPPFFFMKPPDALVTGGANTPYPPATGDLHHEIELVVAIGREGARLAAGVAREHVWGYAAGIDLTRRDLQAEAKRLARPWDMAKGFDHSGPISAIVPAARSGHPARGRLTLTVNGEPRQEGDIADMIWDVPALIAELSSYVTLRPGDLIFTGTPAGVGPVRRGDRLEGTIEGVGTVVTTIV